MAQNNNEIMNAVYKYCSDYHCTDKAVVKHLTKLFIAVGTSPTPAQAKIIPSDSCITSTVASLVQLDAEYTFGYSLTKALVRVLKLREPCFLNTFLTAQSDKLVRVIPISRYLLVCTEEAARNVLKTFDAYTTRANQLEKAYFKRRNEVYEYAMQHMEPDDTFYITNAYQAAWYVLTDDEPQICLKNGVYSAKQLKDAIANVQAIDRYAMIEYRDYEEKITEQAEILHNVKSALFKINAQMHVFRNSTELAEEGIRMGNCIATYWDNDSTSCLFSVDYKDQHMDVELMRDYANEFEAWSVTQVLLAGNTANALTREIETTLKDACIRYNEASKDAWIATYKPNKEICRQANGNCVDCTLRYCCPASLDYADEDDRFDDARIDRIVNLGNDAVNEVLNRMINGEELADIEDDLLF
jgi:hypothetical protein